jgi:L-arabinose isomerase
MEMNKAEFWFVAGSQHLYGPGPLAEVKDHAQRIAASLAPSLPGKLVFKAVLTTPDEIGNLCREADGDLACAGLVLWMHTFSPAKMWIGGLSRLDKPVLHLHTQYNRDIPWASIDMEFMNLNQSAHGDREFGHVMARLRKPRKVVVGHFEEPGVKSRIASWMRAAAGLAETRSLRVIRFGDNMREVAVTEGDKVEAQIRLGWSVNGLGLSELSSRSSSADPGSVDALMKRYREEYEIGPGAAQGPGVEALRVQARMEIALKSILEERGARAFTTNFEDLQGLEQLPGLAVQRLMAAGYGFGAEGDWKTAALVRTMKVMAAGLPGGVSFMEDYTYHLDPANSMVLGAHMLEVCPSIAAGKPRLEVHPLSIGGKADPARLVFDGAPGPALNASLIDMGEGFRLIVNAVDSVPPPAAMPRLPVARTLWKPRPGLREAAEAWILSGGAHHSGYSNALPQETLEDWAAMADIEYLPIDETLDIRAFRAAVRSADRARRS